MKKENENERMTKENIRKAKTEIEEKRKIESYMKEK